MHTEIRAIDGGYVNSYLISHGGVNTLVDYGRHEKMQAALDGAAVGRVLLTHCHRENCADLYLYDCAAAAFGEEYKILRDLPAYWNNWGHVYEELGTPYVRPPIRGPKGGVSDGETMDIGPFVQIATPGHSPSHTAYLLDCGGQRCAFTGGLIYARGKLPNLYDCEQDYGYMEGLFQTAKSARAMAAYKPDVLYPDRGPVIYDGTKALLEFADAVDGLANFLLRDYDFYGGINRDPGIQGKQTGVGGIDEISPNLLRVWQNYSNMYIVLAGGGDAFLVDCWGNGFTGLDINGALEIIAKDYNIKRIICTLLTHYHGDHYLSYKEIKERWEIGLWAYENMVDALENPQRYKYPALLRSYKEFAVSRDSAVRVDRALSEGEEFNIGDVALKVFRLPGQTNMGCCYSAVIDGLAVAFTGDNFYYTPAPGKSGRDCFVVGNMALPEEEGYLKCSRILKGLAPERVLCGHSFIIDDPMPQILALEANSLELIDRLRAFSPENEYEWFADPFWATPYGDVVQKGKTSAIIRVRLKNHSKNDARFSGRLRLPEGFWCEPEEFDITLPPGGMIYLAFIAHIGNAPVLPGKYPITVDICRDGIEFGELFDHVLEVE